MMIDEITIRRGRSRVSGRPAELRYRRRATAPAGSGAREQRAHWAIIVEDERGAEHGRCYADRLAAEREYDRCAEDIGGGWLEQRLEAVDDVPEEIVAAAREIDMLRRYAEALADMVDLAESDLVDSLEDAPRAAFDFLIEANTEPGDTAH